MQDYNREQRVRRKDIFERLYKGFEYLATEFQKIMAKRLIFKTIKKIEFWIKVEWCLKEVDIKYRIKEK
jgi:hypothetical protein